MDTRCKSLVDVREAAVVRAPSAMGEEGGDSSGEADSVVCKKGGVRGVFKICFD